MSEADLCSHFLSIVGDKWTAYPETAGFDILLVRKADGFQIGIEAKLKLNLKVLAQAVEPHGSSVDQPGPDCRAILVPASATSSDVKRIADYIGITIISLRTVGSFSIWPTLPRYGDTSWWDQWTEFAPLRRCDLPEYVPDVVAGSPAPIQLTVWKIAAIKIAVTLEKRGFVTRADFKAHRIDHRLWISNGADWLRLDQGLFVAGPKLPKFREQHPIVFEQIAADAAKWMLAIERPGASK